jgi:hypothetical protein
MAQSQNDRGLLYHAGPAPGNCYELDSQTGAFFFNSGGYLNAYGTCSFLLDSLQSTNGLPQSAVTTGASGPTSSTSRAAGVSRRATSSLCAWFRARLCLDSAAFFFGGGAVYKLLARANPSVADVMWCELTRGLRVVWRVSAYDMIKGK